MNATMAKFGYPGTLIAEEGSWVALTRPSQVTLGAMMLVCREPVTAFGAISAVGAESLRHVVAKSEIALKQAFNYDKINYLMLMMVDPDVHFHVIPRYAESRTFAGQSFQDLYWPKPPDLTVAANTEANVLTKIRDQIYQHWPKS